MISSACQSFGSKHIGHFQDKTLPGGYSSSIFLCAEDHLQFLSSHQKQEGPRHYEGFHPFHSIQITSLYWIHLDIILYFAEESPPPSSP